MSDKCMVSPGRRSVMSASRPQSSGLFYSPFVISAFNEDTKSLLISSVYSFWALGLKLYFDTSPGFKFYKLLFSYMGKE